MGSFAGLLNNAALMLILCIIYDTFNVHAISRKPVRDIITGLIVGCIAIAVMLSPWSLTPGVFFDTRWVLLSLCGLFFGFTPTLIAVLIAGGFRLYQGGAGGIVGTLVILTTAATGLGWRYWKEQFDQELKWFHLYGFGVSVQLVMLSCMALMPAQMRIPIIKAVAPPVLTIYPFLTLILGMILKRQERRRETDRALIKEVRERKEAEAAARDSETHLRTLIETMPDLVWVKNPEGEYLGCNRKYEELMGAKESEILGKTDHDFLPPQKADLFFNHDQRVIGSGVSSRNEYPLVYEADGRSEMVETIKTPMYDREGELIGILGVGRDITDRKEAEKELQKTKEEWEKTFNSITDVVSLQDRELRILKINRAGCDLLGLEPDQILGQYCYTLFTDSDKPCPDCPLMTTSTTLEPHTLEIVNTRLGKTFMVSAAPVFNSREELIQITHVAKDVTEKKQLEQELFHAQKMESIGTLAGGIAHDFNNILSAVMGFSELAQEKSLEGGNIQEELDQIIQSSRRAAELVQHILVFSRKTEHVLEPLSPDLVVREVLQMLRASMPATIDIRESIDVSCPGIMADPTNIHQIVVNLCTNALHAMENQKGILSVSLFPEEVTQVQCAGEPGAKPGMYAVLEIRDTGHGMDDNTLEHIFDPFFTTKEVGKGTGLGLSVIHGIIRDYKGFIRVESSPGQGAAFQVYIPALPSPVSAPSENKISRELHSTGNERILIVDDEARIAELNKTILQRLGYEVTAVTTPVDALEMIGAEPDRFDLLITDQTMPGITGMELSGEVLGINPEMPIIICTGYSSVLSEQEALEMGIKLHIEKPVPREELAKAVRGVLENIPARTLAN